MTNNDKLTRYDPDYFSNLHKNVGYSEEEAIQTADWGSKFEYMGHTGFLSHCLIRCHGNVVICTEAPDNHGESITNAAEIIATRFCLINNIPFEKLIWIEHYIHQGDLATDILDRPTFDFVTFSLYNGALTRPQWKPTNELRVMELFQRG